MMDASLADRLRIKSPIRIESPCIMKSLDPRENASGDTLLNLSEAMNEDFQSLSLGNFKVESPPDSKSLLLLDCDEKLCVPTVEKFLNNLKLDPNQRVKVLSIFGNTGEGKSHTLNHTFFDGEEVFRTSSSQTSCTLGVWAMYDPKLNVICLDTEGLLGVSKKEQQRTRLLLKVLAVSDVIIYRTRAERLQRDMYTFLGSASQAYQEHFSAALKQIIQKSDCDKPTNAMGPAVIIFHETKYTNTLHESATVNESAEDIIRSCFAQLQLNFDSFSSMKYIGIQNASSPTSYNELRIAVERELESTEVRSARLPKFIFLTLKALNEKYKTRLSTATPKLHLNAFFTCQEKCLSCKSSCNLSMGHKDECLPHSCDKPCTFQHQYQNCVFLCKKCYTSGNKIQVEQTYTENSWTGILNYVWAGYSILCPKCGLLYRSRQHWYGNKNPEDCAVRQEIVHIWPGDKHFSQERTIFGTQNPAQKMLDGVTMLSEAVSNVTSQPAKAVGDWMADQVAPSYWRPNHEITKCFKCGTSFAPTAKKHHCRSCGEGFCDACSSKKQPVPHRGWCSDVRVCDDCYKESPPSLSHTTDTNEVRARIIGETVVNSLSAVKSVLEIPKGIIKDTARPAYWMPDSECTCCSVCEKPFGPTLLLHHCRECGKGVCDDCSTSRKPVPARGWDMPVRVCDRCG